MRICISSWGKLNGSNANDVGKDVDKDVYNVNVRAETGMIKKSEKDEIEKEDEVCKIKQTNCC